MYDWRFNGETMKAERDLVRVEILGQSYNVRGEEAKAHIEELARYVDSKMRAIAESTPAGDSLKVAILAALNIADEYFKLKRRHEESSRQWDETINELTRSLDEALKDPEKRLFA